jgi:hypothetical protein
VPIKTGLTVRGKRNAASMFLNPIPNLVSVGVIFVGLGGWGYFVIYIYVIHRVLSVGWHWSILYRTVRYCLAVST